MLIEGPPGGLDEIMDGEHVLDDHARESLGEVLYIDDVPPNEALIVLERELEDHHISPATYYTLLGGVLSGDQEQLNAAFAEEFATAQNPDLPLAS